MKKKYPKKMIGANKVKGMRPGGMAVRFDKDGRALGRPTSKHKDERSTDGAESRSVAGPEHKETP